MNIRHNCGHPRAEVILDGPTSSTVIKTWCSNTRNLFLWK